MSSEGALRILLVDDEPGIRQGLGDLLRTHGHEVRTADSADRAVSELRRSRTDLLITDLRMEGLDGLDLIRTAREIDPELSAMVVTGYASLDVALEAIRLGLVDLIEKPFRARRVLDAISACQRRRPAKVRKDGSFELPLDHAAPSSMAGHLGVLLASRGYRNPARAEMLTAAAQIVRTVLDAGGDGRTIRARVEASAGDATIELDIPGRTPRPEPDGRRLLDLLLDDIRSTESGDRTTVTLVRSAGRRDPDVCRVQPEDAEADLSKLRGRVNTCAAGLPVELDLGECEALSAAALRALDDLVGGLVEGGREVDVVHVPVSVRRAAAALGLSMLAGPAARPEHLIRDTLWS